MLRGEIMWRKTASGVVNAIIKHLNFLESVGIHGENEKLFSVKDKFLSLNVHLLSSTEKDTLIEVLNRKLDLEMFSAKIYNIKEKWSVKNPTSEITDEELISKIYNINEKIQLTFVEMDEYRGDFSLIFNDGDVNDFIFDDSVYELAKMNNHQNIDNEDEWI